MVFCIGVLDINNEKNSRGSNNRLMLRDAIVTVLRKEGRPLSLTTIQRGTEMITGKKSGKKSITRLLNSLHRDGIISGKEFFSLKL